MSHDTTGWWPGPPRKRRVFPAERVSWLVGVLAGLGIAALVHGLH